MRVMCPYCSRAARLVSGAVLYPHLADLTAKQFYQCEPCQAHVGCHPPAGPDGRGGQGDGTVPLGRLANAELRRAKQKAHAAFDALWRFGGMTRRDAYARLAEQLGISVAECHIGMFDVPACTAVVSAVDTIRQEPP